MVHTVIVRPTDRQRVTYKAIEKSRIILAGFPGKSRGGSSHGGESQPDAGANESGQDRVAPQHSAGASGHGTKKIQPKSCRAAEGYCNEGLHEMLP